MTNGRSLILIISVIVLAALGTAIIVVIIEGGSIRPDRASSSNLVTTPNDSCIQNSSIITDGPNPSGDYFLVRVNYSGSWDGVITAYSALSQNSTYLHSSLCVGGTGSRQFTIPAWNVEGEQSAWVVATKLDSANGNLTVAVSYGPFLRTNSTTSPMGTAETSVGVTP